MSTFKEASKLALRFPTSKGELTVEQLWQLSLTDLSNLIKNVKKILKKSDDDELSFLDEKNTVDTVNQLRFDCAKEIYIDRKTEQELLRTERERKEQNQKIMSIIANKKEQSLQNMDIADLEKMLQ